MAPAQAQLIVGIDLGKTRFRAAIFDLEAHGRQRLEPIARLGHQTPQDGIAPIVDMCAQSVVELGLAVGRPAAVGIGTFGIVQSHTGKVLKSRSLPFWNNVPLGEDIASTIDLPCFVINDVAASALGFRFIDGDSAVCTALIQLGTSVGMGGYGSHLDGASRAPNFGQISRTLSSRGAPWGQRLGGRGFIELAKPALGDVASAQEVFDRAQLGDTASKSLVLDYVDALAELGSLVAAMTVPDRIIISGGMASGVKPFERDLIKRYKEHVEALWSPPDLDLRPTEGVGELGAAAWARRRALSIDETRPSSTQLTGY